MTLILSISNPAVSIHASDRRVTIADKNIAPKIHSHVENKTIIFIADDAVGTIGFTGIAFVKNQPTDQWIANLIAPQPIGMPQLGTLSFGGRGLGRMKLRTIIWNLSTAMAKLPWALRKHGLTIQLSGFRIRRNYTIPFIVEIQWKGGSPIIESMMRMPTKNSVNGIIGDTIGQIGDGWPLATTIKAVNIHTRSAPRRDIESKRRAAIDIIRKRAKQSPAVGFDLMTVVVPNPLESKEITWQFEPENRHWPDIDSRNPQQKLQAIYSPWIITPSMVVCPTVSSHGMTFSIGAFKIVCGNVGANPAGKGSRLLFLSSHQRRIGPPR